MSTLGGAACGGDGPGEDLSSADNTTTTSGVEDTTAAPGPADQAIAAYNRMWEEEFAALDPPDPAHEGLGQVLTGDAYQSILDVISMVQSNGEAVVDGRMETHPVPVSETAEKVTLRDCSVEHGTNVDLSTGDEVSSGPYEPTPRVVEVVLMDGVWLVSSIDSIEEETCTPG